MLIGARYSVSHMYIYVYIYVYIYNVEQWNMGNSKN